MAALDLKLPLRNGPPVTCLYTTPDQVKTLGREATPPTTIARNTRRRTGTMSIEVSKEEYFFYELFPAD